MTEGSGFIALCQPQHICANEKSLTLFFIMINKYRDY